MASIKEIARDLRKNQTKAEKKFWEIVRNRQINGRKILRQYAIIFDYGDSKRFFIADFICLETGLVIEIDGKIHLRQQDHDEMRSHILKRLGYKIVRFKNDEVHENIEKVKEKLKKYL